MIPLAVTHDPSPGVFTLHPDTHLDADRSLAAEAGWLRATLGAATGCHLPPGTGGITLGLDSALAFEGYELTVTPEAIEIRGGSPAGVFYGAQTLRQLLPPAALRKAAVSHGPWTVPCGRIADAPRFAWRGVLLDVARHFMPVADVLRFVEVAAFHKLNVLHLHLTDDQGWRFGVPGWPRLATHASWRAASMLGSRQHELHDERPHGGCYSDDDLREIVAFAAARHVTVVPEVDMPGHMQAAISAYPEIGNGFAGPVRTSWGISSHVLNLGPVALGFCRDVLDHVCDLFPSTLIGIGGDECPADEWEAAGEEKGQARFTALMAGHLAARGRRVYGWDEILAGGAPEGAVIAAWRGPEPTTVAVRAGHEVVACPDIAVYLDYRQSDEPGEPTPVGTRLTLEDVYAFDPVPAGLGEKEAELVLGGQANVWTEHMESARRVDYQAYPRLCALAETVWTPAASRDFASFAERLGNHYERLAALGVEYRPPAGPKPWHARPDAPGNPRTLDDRLAELRVMTEDLRK